MRTFIHSITHRLGRQHPIENLFAAEAESRFGVQFYSARGLRHYCAQVESTYAMCLSVVESSLRRATLDPAAVGAVLIDADYWHCTEEDRTQILESLHRAGIRRVPVLGLGLQTCSGCMTAFDLAARLVRTDDERRPVLILVCGRAAPGASRVDPLRATILSDGVAACVVSSERRGYELLAAASYTALDNVRSNVAGEQPVNSLLSSHTCIASLSQTLYARAEIQPEDVDTLFCTNGSLIYTGIAADAARVSSKRVYNDCIAQYAHVFSCDHLIALATHADSVGARSGAKYLLLGWSPYVFSGALLSHV